MMKTVAEMNGWVPRKMWAARVIKSMAVALCLSPVGWVAILVGVAVVAAGTAGAAGGGWAFKNGAEMIYDAIVERWYKLEHRWGEV